MATEQAYKNGYDNGYKDAVGKFTVELKERIWQMCWDEDASVPYPFDFIDKIADKLVEKIEEEHKE